MSSSKLSENGEILETGTVRYAYAAVVYEILQSVVALLWMSSKHKK